MTPQECRAKIRDAYTALMEVVNAGRMNESAVFGIIESRCRTAAWHNGMQGAWRSYMPEELLRSPPRIVCAANLYPVHTDGSQVVVLGARHFDSVMRRHIAQLQRLGYNIEAGTEVQGFIDQHGTFYTREAAYEIAFNNGQIIRDGHITGELFSEHLY